MIPLEEFKKLVPDGEKLTEDQLIIFRDLIDGQAELILDSFMIEKAKKQQMNNDTI
ncbi:hypothetical protein K2P47_00260 [Patescibacteria group bacterium]|nr:hypothetical protein [Patescibacteria group bacterium]